MTDGAAYVLLLLALALATFACRAGGFWIMGYVSITPRLEAALRAAPLAVMIGVVAPAAIRGSIAELAGLAGVLVVMLWRRNDLVATLAGVAIVASLRLLQR